jgi:hypothetical protein
MLINEPLLYNWRERAFNSITKRSNFEIRFLAKRSTVEYSCLMCASTPVFSNSPVCGQPRTGALSVLILSLLLLP